MQTFKYHPDNSVYIEGLNPISYAEFMIVQPDFPIEEGKFFEIDAEGNFSIILGINGNGFITLPIDITKIQITISTIQELMADIPDKMAFHYAEKITQEDAIRKAEENRLDAVRAAHGDATAIERLRLAQEEIHTS